MVNKDKLKSAISFVVYNRETNPKITAKVKLGLVKTEVELTKEDIEWLDAVITKLKEVYA